MTKEAKKIVMGVLETPEFGLSAEQLRKVEQVISESVDPAAEDDRPTVRNEVFRELVAQALSGGYWRGTAESLADAIARGWEADGDFLARYKYSARRVGKEMKGLVGRHTFSFELKKHGRHPDGRDCYEIDMSKNS